MLIDEGTICKLAKGGNNDLEMIMMIKKAGVIYILITPSFPEYVKIGYADDIDKRLQQLN